MLENLTDYLIPFLLIAVSLFALHRREDAYSLLIAGAQNGLHTLFSVIPALVVLLTAVSMLRASGFFELLTTALAPLCRKLGIPPEVVPLMLIRPVSGSAALAVGAELMQTYGADSPVGRTAAVMLGSSETTFYTISVYFGAAGIRRTRYALPAALLADLACFLSACLSVRLFFG